MSQPRISQVNTWTRYKQDIFSLIAETLLLLQQQPDLPEIEDSTSQPSLNRELFRCFRKACKNLGLTYHLPTREGKNPPYFGDITPKPREEKRPDFYWQFIDSLADEASCEKRFILECKRLGSPSSANWKLNQNYLNHGILRFLSAPHEYGKGDDEGAMVGYIQSMDLEDIYREISQAIQDISEPIPLLQLLGEWKEKDISKLVHDCERQFPISPYRLHHFWVDLRK